MPVRSPVRMARAFQLAQGAARHDVLAVLVVPEDLDVGVEFLERAVEPLGAAEHPVLAREEAGVRGAVGGDEAGGEVTGTDILGEGARHVASDGLLEGMERVGHGEVRIACV